MILTNAVLHTLNQGFSAMFQKAFAETKTKWQKIATEVPSNTSDENYGWLGQFPSLREWIGERQIKNMTASEYTIKNKDYEATVAVKRNDIEDDKLGIYAPMMQDMGYSAAIWPEDLVFSLLKDGFTKTCYDKKPFFSTDHKVAKANVSNKGAAKLSAKAYGEARAAMMSFKNDEGKPLKIMPNVLEVPPALEGEALKIVTADQIEGTTNIYKGTAEVLVAPELAGKDTCWFLLDTNRPLKPFIFQKRKAPKLNVLNQENDQNVFMRNEYLYGIDARGNAGYGFWQMAYGSDGSAADSVTPPAE
ncbi:Mu-like prophage major head subunit gpT family protein [Dielma fastidiosa]|uniref:Mu-like prophage major head subunit gpT family protein n=1 Tax=Dielma fastidiosa TaxID=1034346 RepID=A0AB35UP84_9FIRM|nr:Mu-like prophage major head subunit gpT family protein [Dielma fastidiosa]MDY5168598.1 Mu-like prophage major head subunit gpT family protein [Dielma fastidiosa]